MPKHRQLAIVLLVVGAAVIVLTALWSIAAPFPVVQPLIAVGAGYILVGIFLNRQYR